MRFTAGRQVLQGPFPSGRSATGVSRGGDGCCYRGGRLLRCKYRYKQRYLASSYQQDKQVVPHKPQRPDGVETGVGTALWEAEIQWLLGTEWTNSAARATRWSVPGSGPVRTIPEPIRYTVPCQVERGSASGAMRGQMGRMMCFFARRCCLCC